MAASKEAMDDLRRILSGRAAFYSKADMTVDTSGRDLASSFQLLRSTVRDAMSHPPVH
ncbi:anaerobic benzoate catabolism transcriptional regulator [compost metagenome]